MVSAWSLYVPHSYNNERNNDRWIFLLSTYTWYISIYDSTEVSKKSFFCLRGNSCPKNFVSPCNEQLMRVVRSGVHRLGWLLPLSYCRYIPSDGAVLYMADKTKRTARIEPLCRFPFLKGDSFYKKSPRLKETGVGGGCILTMKI